MAQHKEKWLPGDFRPRTRPGYYKRGSDIVRIDDVAHWRQAEGKTLGVADWWIYGVGMLMDHPGGPEEGDPAASVEMQLYKFTGGNWKRITEDKLSPAWKAFFKRNPPYKDNPARGGKTEYEVVVGNIGTVYRGRSQRLARDSFREYCDQSRRGVGRAAGEPVTLLQGGEPVDEFDPGEDGLTGNPARGTAKKPAPSQMQKYRKVESDRHARMNTSNEIMTGPMPLTKDEIRRLTKKLQEHGYMQSFLDEPKHNPAPKPWGERTYAVLVGNIGTVYQGKNPVQARIDFKKYCEKSQSGQGRAGGEPVTLLRDGEPIEEFDPGEDGLMDNPARGTAKQYCSLCGKNFVDWGRHEATKEHRERLGRQFGSANRGATTCASGGRALARRNPEGKLLGEGDRIVVRGRRWFQKSYGNTYFSATIEVNDSLVGELPMEYGYGDYYLQAAGKWLQEHGYTDQQRHVTGGLETLPHYCRKAGVKLDYYAVDVQRERDLGGKPSKPTRRNPETGIEPDDGLVEAAFIAHQWHGGQGSDLYKLGCGQWDHLTNQDVHGALLEFESCMQWQQANPKSQESPEALEDLQQAIDSLTAWCKKHPVEDDDLEQNPAMSVPVKAAIGVGILAAVGGAAWYFTREEKKG